MLGHWCGDPVKGHNRGDAALKLRGGGQLGRLEEKLQEKQEQRGWLREKLNEPGGGQQGRLDEEPQGRREQGEELREELKEPDSKQHGVGL